MPTPMCTVQEPLRPRRPAPHRYRSTMQLSTAPELFPLHRRLPPRICFPAADRRPPHHTQQLGHGFVQGCTVLHKSGFRRTTRRSSKKRRTQHCQQKEVLLFPYSCKSYVSAHTVFIPRKKLVERFLLHLLRDTKCTRFPPFYYFTFARGQ